jgi:hypothetical protein
MPTRSLLAALLLAMLVVSGVYPAQSRAAAAAPTAKAKRLLVSPRPGQVVRSHHVRLRVRSRTLTDTLRVRLNGTQIGEDFGAPRRGMRTLRASLSHGLRRGRNVLRVTVRSRRGAIRTARARFVVRTRRHLVGAGRDRELAVDGKVRIRGAVRTQPRGDAGAKLRWRLVRAPRRSPAHDALLGGAAPHTLTSPGGKSASFRPRVPGSYTLRLSAGGGSRAASDTVTFDVKPRNLLVPIETMTATDDANGDQRGIRVGDTTYLLRDAAFSTPSGSVLQVLVLKRDTLEFVSNRKYLGGPALAEDLGRLDASKLVILVLQPGGLPGFQYGELDKAVGRIGVPDMGASLPKNTGLMSAIGVPGMAPGDADVNILTGSTGPIAPMKGYLAPDQYGNFGFVPSERKTFTFPPQPNAPCQTDECLDRVGFRVRHLDGRTLAPAAHDGEIYRTNGRSLTVAQAEAEARRMGADLAAFPQDNVVMIEAVSSYKPGEGVYRPPVGPIGRETMAGLANAIQSLGGTRNAFNRIATVPGAGASGGMTYALVGWTGSHEGAGEEVAAGVDGAGAAPTLSVVLRPDRQSRFRPAATDEGPDALSELVLEKPTNVWPLLDLPCRPPGLQDDDPGAKLALAYLGSTDGRIGSDPRSAYATQRFKEASTWNDIARAIEVVQYRDVPESRRDTFTENQFLAARCQLATELRWVANVRLYLEDLASPFADNALKSYADVQEVGDRVYEDAHNPDEEIALHWVEFVEILLELAGPVTHEVSSTVAGLMELGVWAFGDDPNGEPIKEIPFEARKLGSKIADQMQDVTETYESIGDVIVTDSAKLAYVGAHGNCLPTKDETCPKGYSFTADDRRRVSSDLSRGVERMAYQTLLPLGFHVFRLNGFVSPNPPDPRKYKCSYWPWYYYSPPALSNATTALLQEKDSRYGVNNTWQTLVLSRPPAPTTRWGQPPSDELLKRMFDPVANSNNPKEGGLAISPSKLMAGARWTLWDPDFRSGHDSRTDQCTWEN